MLGQPLLPPSVPGLEGRGARGAPGGLGSDDARRCGEAFANASVSGCLGEAFVRERGEAFASADPFHGFGSAGASPSRAFGGAGARKCVGSFSTASPHGYFREAEARTPSEALAATSPYKTIGTAHGLMQYEACASAYMDPGGTDACRGGRAIGATVRREGHGCGDAFGSPTMSRSIAPSGGGGEFVQPLAAGGSGGIGTPLRAPSLAPVSWPAYVGLDAEEDQQRLAWDLQYQPTHYYFVLAALRHLAKRFWTAKERLKRRCLLEALQDWHHVGVRQHVDLRLLQAERVLVSSVERARGQLLECERREASHEASLKATPARRHSCDQAAVFKTFRCKSTNENPSLEALSGAAMKCRAHVQDLRQRLATVRAARRASLGAVNLLGPLRRAATRQVALCIGRWRGVAGRSLPLEARLTAQAFSSLRGRSGSWRFRLLGANEEELEDALQTAAHERRLRRRRQEELVEAHSFAARLLRSALRSLVHRAYAYVVVILRQRAVHTASPRVATGCGGRVGDCGDDKELAIDQFSDWDDGEDDEDEGEEGSRNNLGRGKVSDMDWVTPSEYCGSSPNSMLAPTEPSVPQPPCSGSGSANVVMQPKLPSPGTLAKAVQTRLESLLPRHLEDAHSVKDASCESDCQLSWASCDCFDDPSDDGGMAPMAALEEAAPRRRTGDRVAAVPWWESARERRGNTQALGVSQRRWLPDGVGVAPPEDPLCHGDAESSFGLLSEVSSLNHSRQEPSYSFSHAAQVLPPPLYMARGSDHEDGPLSGNATQSEDALAMWPSDDGLVVL